MLCGPLKDAQCKEWHWPHTGHGLPIVPDSGPRLTKRSPWTGFSSVSSLKINCICLWWMYPVILRKTIRISFEIVLPLFQMSSSRRAVLWKTNLSVRPGVCASVSRFVCDCPIYGKTKIYLLINVLLEKNMHWDNITVFHFTKFLCSCMRQIMKMSVLGPQLAFVKTKEKQNKKNNSFSGFVCLFVYHDLYRQWCLDRWFAK